MGKRRWTRFVFSVMGMVGVFLGPQLLNLQQVEACESCNTALLKESLEGHLNSPRGRHILAAAQNQKGLNFEGLSQVQEASEEIVEAYLVAQLEKAQEAEARSKVVSNARPAFDLKQILQRDAKLAIPETGYVDQSVKADKVVEIRMSEGQTYLGNGVVYDGFLINDTIPGPTLRVQEGDVVEFKVINDGAIPHGASVHSVYSQSSKYLGNIQPGETKSLKFRATQAGVFLYHCAPGGHAIPMHVLAGQYGTIIVEPKKKYKLEQMLGHGPDLELFLTQHELYANGKDAIEGNAAYTMFNGKLFRYVEEPLVVRPGDYVRINFLNVGPNLMSTFHIVGILWDYVYWQGNPDEVMAGGQTVLAGPSDSWVIEFRIPPEEGAYTMLSHAVGSTSRGAIGLLVADKNAPRRTEPVLADGPKYSEEEMKTHVDEAVRIISPFKPGSRELKHPKVHSNPNEEAVVYIIGNSYSPEVLEIPVGTTVTWINEEAFTYLAGEVSGVHNVVMIDGPEPFMSPMLAHGESWSHTFTTEGTYDYMCAPHPYMRGRIVVTGAKLAAVGGRGGVPAWWWAIVALLILGNVGALAVALNRKG